MGGEVHVEVKCQYVNVVPLSYYNIILMNKGDLYAYIFQRGIK